MTSRISQILEYEIEPKFEELEADLMVEELSWLKQFSFFNTMIPGRVYIIKFDWLNKILEHLMGALTYWH